MYVRMYIYVHINVYMYVIYKSHKDFSMVSCSHLHVHSPPISYILSLDHPLQNFARDSYAVIQFLCASNN